jgi:hypothetical protein
LAFDGANGLDDVVSGTDSQFGNSDSPVTTVPTNELGTCFIVSSVYYGMFRDAMYPLGFYFLKKIFTGFVMPT